MEQPKALQAQSIVFISQLLNVFLSDLSVVCILDHVKICLWSGGGPGPSLQREAEEEIDLKISPRARSTSTVLYKLPRKEMLLGECDFILCHLIKGRWPNNTNNKRCLKGEIFLSEKILYEGCRATIEENLGISMPHTKSPFTGDKMRGLQKIFMLYKTIKSIS